MCREVGFPLLICTGACWRVPNGAAGTPSVARHCVFRNPGVDGGAMFLMGSGGLASGGLAGGFKTALWAARCEGGLFCCFLWSTKLKKSLCMC
jgi:hypothetical protein